MNDNTHFDQDDLALFAMQLLSAEEMSRLQAQLDLSPDLRRELAEVQGDLAVYANTVEMHTPPVIARERLLTQIGRERKVHSIDRIDDHTQHRVGLGDSDSFEGRLVDEPGPRSTRIPPNGNADITANPENDPQAPGNHPRARFASGPVTEHTSPEQTGLGRLVPWFGWAVAAALAVTTGNFYHESEALRGSMARDHAQLTRLTADAAAARQLMEILKDPSATRVTLTRSKEAPAPQGKVTYVADKGALLFVASNLDPLDTYKVYELWLIPANGQAPLPAGTFHPDAHGNASVVLPQLPAGLVAKAFGVTLEDEGGSQTPTMPILLSGAANGL